MENIRDEETIEIRIQGGKFKQFDIIEEASSFSDHHYYNRPPKKYSDQWRNTISQEWDIFKERLPDSIFVRANRERPDLLRALIIGPQGSPYHDGLFFFDIQFPSKYPDTPPRIHYCCYDVKSMNRHIPYIDSLDFLVKHKIPLVALLLWIHGYQVYTADTLLYTPDYNYREQTTLMCKEGIFTNSWNTMVSVINKPPKCFEEFVSQHFLDQAKTILTTCKAYINGRVKRADTDIPNLRQEKFDLMESIYYKLVSAFQKNGSSLENLCKLGIQFHGKPSCSRRKRIITWIGAFIVCSFMVILMYFVLGGFWRQAKEILNS
ncbi:hypothetical protein MKW98_004315 [Papaver atlanticum]|uniref:UBC core domain-containing protein n=1 Tax=Papaver atlanticum TaxID=357466 RepID=A0AAD4XTJ8_9MAGN|nr:hypothetical protein MKW98_004315 [Papaver atlanticum]